MLEFILITSLIVKLHAYGLDISSLSSLQDYLSNCKQRTKEDYANDNMPFAVTDNIKDVIRSLEEVGENLSLGILTITLN